MKHLFILLGSLNLMLVVSLGAFGAHALKDRLSESMMAVYQTGIQYHFYHAVGLMLVLCQGDIVMFSRTKSGTVRGVFSKAEWALCREKTTTQWAALGPTRRAPGRPPSAALRRLDIRPAMPAPTRLAENGLLDAEYDNITLTEH